jgi:hypothetical protein
MKRYAVLIALLAGCTTAPQRPPAPPVLASTEAWYQQAEAAGKHILYIDAHDSLIAITVHRGGALARLGHEHIVACHTLAGFVAPEAGRADFHFRLDELSVDEPQLRREAGFDTQPSEDAVSGTRSNMLGPVLHADQFPLVQLHAERMAGAAATTVRLSVTLHGVTRSFDVPAHIQTNGEGLSASGTLSLLQSDFGIVPMSVLGGAISVPDQLDMRFRISARPAPRR